MTTVSRRSMTGVVAPEDRPVPDGTVERWSTSAGRPGPRSRRRSSSPPSRAGTTPATPPAPRPATSSTAGTLDLVADVDPEEFYDFTSTRPEVRLDDDGLREIVWPATEIHAGTIPGGDQDVLVIIGTEPQLRWRTYCGELTEIAQSHGARLCLTLGALLAEVPHTRPTPIVGTAYEPDVVAGLDLQPSRYEGPTGIVGVLHDAWRRAGPPVGVAVGHGARLRARRAVAQGRAGAHRAHRRRCSRPGCPPPTSRSRPRPTSAR